MSTSLSRRKRNKRGAERAVKRRLTLVQCEESARISTRVLAFFLLRAVFSESTLVKKKIETVVLSGFLTNCCVESTMRTAYEKGT